MARRRRRHLPRWNWRQTTRTQLHEGTTAALFILDGLDPLPDDALHAAADDLLTQLAATSPSLRSAVRLIRRRGDRSDRHAATA